MLNIISIIEKKRDNKVLTSDEIKYFVSAYAKGDIPDYQIASLLMAIVLNGMNEDETFALTKAMLESGEIINLEEIEGIIVDKHSTGGVGDKTTLVLAPMLAALGLSVAKMSGRGLGHTGGTIDKLESILNFNIELDKASFIRQVNAIKIAVIGQTDNIVPADKKLYALRDTTGTVKSIPLIASSIMSKKLATGADIIILDVKVGDGAFMKNIEEARLLAKTMVGIGKQFNKKVVAFLTNMNAPLGFSIGNSLEVIEAVETLKGNSKGTFYNLCIELCKEALLLAEIAKGNSEAFKMAQDTIENLSALEKFKDLVVAQSGNPEFINDYAKLPRAKIMHEIRAKKNGYLSSVSALDLGMFAMRIGAGRSTKEDEINYGAGLVLRKNIGDAVKEGDILCVAYTDLVLEEISMCENAFVISDERSKFNDSVILDVIK